MPEWSHTNHALENIADLTAWKDKHLAYKLSGRANLAPYGADLCVGSNPTTLASSSGMASHAMLGYYATAEKQES